MSNGEYLLVRSWCVGRCDEEVAVAGDDILGIAVSLLAASVFGAATYIAWKGVAPFDRAADPDREASFRALLIGTAILGPAPVLFFLGIAAVLLFDNRFLFWVAVVFSAVVLPLALVVATSGRPQALVPRHLRSWPGLIRAANEGLSTQRESGTESPSSEQQTTDA